MSEDNKEKREEQQQHRYHVQESKEQGPTMSSSSSTQAVASIGSYCLANMAMTVTNKYVFSVCLFPGKIDILPISSRLY
jgi:hypothetical protein